MVDEEPLKAITKESHEGSDEHDDGKGKVHESETRGPTENLSHVVGGCEVVKLNLRDSERRFQRRRVLGEVEIGTRKRLNPNRDHKDHPLPRLPRHQSQKQYASSKRASMPRRFGIGRLGVIEIESAPITTVFAWPHFIYVCMYINT